MTTDELGKLLESLGLERLRLRGSNWTACCPNHEERRPSWGIRTDYPHVHGCYACGFKGTLYTLLRDKFHYSVARALQTLGEVPKTHVLKDWKLKDSKKVEARTEPLPAPTVLFPYAMEPKGLYYLAGRGITVRSISKAHLLYDRYRKRILFPWYHPLIPSQLLGASSRSTVPSPEKGRAYFGLKKAKYLYAPVPLARKSRLVLVEGEIDALKVMQAGFSVAALCFGSVSDAQLDFLDTLQPREVILFFDNDATGQRLTTDYEAALASRWPCSRVRYGDSDSKLDPGCLTLKSIRDLILRRQSSNPALRQWHFLSP